MSQDTIKALVDAAEWLEWHYEGLARAECARQGVSPDEIISDAGHLAWQWVGHEVARKVMKR